MIPNLGKKLRKARKLAELTQEEVAQLADISANYYAMIERGEKDNPSFEILSRIVKALGADIRDFI